MKITDSIQLNDGSLLPRLGQGTWKIGEDDQKQQHEIDGLKYGINAGITMIDTAEMYADGKAELVTGSAISEEDREKLYIIDKVYPQNANRHHIYSSLQRSLRLLGTSYLDLYLLHWREDADLAEVAACMEDLKRKGLIRRWGVSNFDVQDMEDLWHVPDGKNCCVNEVLYNLGSRGIEYDLLPWQREHGVATIAYGPVGQAGAMVTQDGVSKKELMTNPHVREAAERLGVSVVQLLLAFVLQQPDVAAIPKASSPAHIDDNIQACNLRLTDEDILQFTWDFPAPTKKIPMEKY